MTMKDSAFPPEVEPPENVLRAWGEPLVAEGTIGRSVWLVRQGTESFILKKRASAIPPEAEGSMLRLLLEQGIPVAPPIPASSGQQALTCETGQWALYPRLPGRSATMRTLAMPEAQALGAALAALHRAFCHVVAGDWLASLSLKTDLQGCAIGLIHRDFHASNILFHAGRVSGIVDFDLACKGPRTFDVAYLAVSLLADSWSDSAARERFSPVLVEIVRGYETRTQLSAQEISSVPLLLEEIEQMFVALGRTIGNRHMEMGAAEVQAWLQARRGETIEALAAR